MRLIDVDADLVEGLSDGERAVARDIKTPMKSYERGQLRIPQFAAGTHSFLILSGLILHRVRLRQIVVAEILGPGDLLRGPADAPDAGEEQPVVLWPEALGHVQLAGVDESVQHALLRVPGIAARLLRRADERLERFAQIHAASRLQRVEDRIILVLQLLCARWGRVTPFGIVLPYRLTHEQLGLIVGARRSSVTTVLRDLQRDGHVLLRPDRCLVVRHGLDAPADSGRVES